MRSSLVVAMLVPLAGPVTAQSTRADGLAFQAEVATYAEEHARHARALTLAYVCRAREIRWFDAALDILALRTLEDADRIGRGVAGRLDYALAYFTGSINATRRAAVAEQRRFPIVCDGAANAAHVTIYDGLVRQ